MSERKKDLEKLRSLLLKKSYEKKQVILASGKESDFKISYKKATNHLSSGKVFQHLIKIQSR